MGFAVKASVAEDFPSGSVFYIVNVSGGCCLQAKGSQGVFTYICKEDKDQYWQAEYQGEAAEKIAFKNVGNGEYLYGSGPHAGARIQTRGQPQWWTASKGYTKNAYYFKCDDYPDAWLVNRDGSHREGSRTDCWPFQDVWSHALSWSLQDAPDFTPNGWAGNVPKSQSAPQAAQEVDQDKASDVSAAQSKSSKEAFERDQRLADREAELTKREKDMDQTRADREAQLVKREQDRDQAMADREADLTKRERAIVDREAAVIKQSSQAMDKMAESHELRQVKAELADLCKQMKAFTDRDNKPTPSKPPPNSDENSTGSCEEITRLKELIAEQAMQLYGRQEPSTTESKRPTGQQQQNGSPKANLTAAGSNSRPSAVQAANVSKPMVSGKSVPVKSTANQNSDESIPGSKEMEEATKKQHKMLQARSHDKQIPGKSRSPKALAAAVDHDGSHFVVFDCGHVLHKPPRKIRQKVVGMLYA